MTTRTGRIGVLALLASVLGACTPAPKPAVIVVLPGEYERAFDATREVLLEHKFALERVDAAGGVITTQNRATAGLASPWDTDQSSVYQEWEDATNQQQRAVRVTFAPEGDDGAAAPDEPLVDRRADDRTLVARIEVDLLRARKRGWRVETEAITRSSRYRDPVTAQRIGGEVFLEPIGHDELLAGRIAAGIRARLGAPAQGDPIADTGD